MIPFMKFKWASLTLSTLFIGASFFMIFIQRDGLVQGIDFAGGIKLEIAVNEKVTIDSLRTAFKKFNIEAGIHESGKETIEIAKVEIGGQEETKVQKRAMTKSISKELDKSGFAINSVDYIQYLLIKELSPKKPEMIELLRQNHVGPTIGDYLKKSALKLILITLVLITIYITRRFRFQYAIGALVALLHDLAMTIGFIGILGIPLSIPIIAALLTILGYSINDTIVVFDRIRENLRGNEKVNFENLVDKSINQSLTRTVITSVTTLIAIVSVYLLAGDNLRDMALVLILGIIIGTYSSSFIASPVVVLWSRVSNK